MIDPKDTQTIDMFKSPLQTKFIYPCRNLEIAEEVVKAIKTLLNDPAYSFKISHDADSLIHYVIMEK